MINKEYQYFNGQNISIYNSIVSKTTNMVIKGRTLQNLAKQQIFVDNTINQNPSQHKYYS